MNTPSNARRRHPLTLEQKLQVEAVASALVRLDLDHEAEILRAKADAGTLFASLASAADGWLYLVADAALTAAIQSTGGKTSLEYMIAQRNLHRLGEAADQLALEHEAQLPPATPEARRASFRVVPGGRVPSDMMPTIPPRKRGSEVA